MPVNGKGRDCSKCERNIRDFTKMSDNELIAVLNAEKKICGRFTAEQMNRPLLSENRGLLPTFNLYAVAAGFGALIAFPSFGSDLSYQETTVNLIELLHNREAMPTAFTDEVKDSLTHFYVLDNHRYQRIVGANIRLYDDHGKLIDAIQTDDDGYASYPFEALEQHRIHEIKISATNLFEEQTIAWTPDQDQHFIITLESSEAEEPRPIFMGISVRIDD